MKSITRGIFALMIVSAILLISDLQNRNSKKDNLLPNDQAKSDAIAGRNYILGLCYFAPEESNDEELAGFWRRLKELGYVRDSNLIVKESHANGEVGNIASILLNMDTQPMDLLVVNSTPCVSAALATVKNHPVAFSYCFDPIAAGVGTSLEDHAPGITGIGSFPPIEKTIQFILETIPGTMKIGTIYNNSEANSRKVVSMMRQLAEKYKFKLVEMSVVNSSEVFQTAQVMASTKIDALYIPGDNTVRQAFDAVAGVCASNSIPLISNHLTNVGKGAFAAIGTGWYGVGYRTGNLVGRMLNGASPDKIPIENYVNDSIAIDENKVKKLGLTIPQKYRNIKNSLPSGVKFKICMVHFVDSQNSEDCEKGIRKLLEDQKLVEGINFTFKVFNAQGDVSTLNSIAGSIGSETWDLVFATSTPTVQMLVKKLPNEKIVFTNVGDPVAAGLGKTFEDHLPNICGISTMSDFDGLVNLVKTIHPGIKKVGTVFTPAEVNSVSYMNRLNEAAKKQGIMLITVPASSASEVLDAAKTLVANRIEAFCQISDNLTSSCSSAILRVSLDSKVPCYGFVTHYLSQGAVAVCARDNFQAGYETGLMGIAVLSGENPAKIPFRFVKKTDYLISLENARMFKVPVTDRLFTIFPNLKIVKQ